MKKAIYPGSFDPITNGHIDIVKRSLNVFDEVTIAVFENPDKQPLFTFEERVALIKDIFKDNTSIKVEKVAGLLVHYADRINIHTIIRGLRAVSDFEFEFQLALTNRSLNSNIDSVFFMTDDKYSYISSSVVKQIKRLNGDVSQFVPVEVEKALKGKENE